MAHPAAVGPRPRWRPALRGLLLLAALALLANAPLRAATAWLRPAADDSFPHARHMSVACLVCHLSKTGEKLTFEPPRGCQICHHREVASRAPCTLCHEKERLPDTLMVRIGIAAAGKPSRERAVSFPHARHLDLPCASCHASSVTMAPLDSASTCNGCHDKHHGTGPTCSVCHRTATIAPAHARPVRPHVACDACHSTATIARLTPSRSLCLACHPPAVDHHPERECVTCHFQASPEEYQARLLKRVRAP